MNWEQGGIIAMKRVNIQVIVPFGIDCGSSHDGLLRRVSSDLLFGGRLVGYSLQQDKFTDLFKKQLSPECPRVFCANLSPPAGVPATGLATLVDSKLALSHHKAANHPDRKSVV